MIKLVMMILLENIKLHLSLFDVSPFSGHGKLKELFHRHNLEAKVDHIMHLIPNVYFLIGKKLRVFSINQLN